MGACTSTGQPEGQTTPASFSKQPPLQPAGQVQLTAYQQKATATLKNIGSKSGPPLDEWKLSVSDDPNAELLVFPLLEFEGYHGGKGLGAEVGGKPDANAKAIKDQTKAAAQKQESRAKAKRDKSGRVTSFRPLGPDEIVEAQKLPFWPDECDLAASADEGKGGREEDGMPRLAPERKVSRGVIAAALMLTPDQTFCLTRSPSSASSA